MTGSDATWMEQGIALLGDLTVKATLILALAGGATFLMRRAAAATRHLVWSAAVVAVLLLPLMRMVAPQWALPSFPSMPAFPSMRALLPVVATTPAAPPMAATAPIAATPVSTIAPLASHAGTAPLSAGRAGAMAGHPVPDARTTPARAPKFEPAGAPVAEMPDAAAATDASTELQAPPVPAAGEATGVVAPSMLASVLALVHPYAAVPTVLLAVWAAGALAILLRLVVGTLSLARVARRAPRVTDREWHALLGRLVRDLGIRRPVRLLEGGRGDVPMTWGVLRPVVLLPRDADGWSEGRRRAVLLHELAHVERFDTLTHILSQVALSLLWFHPLALLASRRLRAERERACDDLVLAMGTVRATAYADDLLELVQTLGTPRALSAALAMARPTEFEGRLISILDPRAPRVRVDRRRAGFAVVVMVGAALPLAGMRSAEAAGAPASQRATRATREGIPTRDSLAPLGEVARVTSVLDSLPAMGALPDVDLDSLVRVTTGDTTGTLTTSLAVDGMLTARVREEMARAQRALDSARLALDVAHDDLEARRTRIAPAPVSAAGGASATVTPSPIAPASPAPGASRATSAAAAPPAQSTLSAAALVDVIRATKGMGSDSDRAAVLLRLVPRMAETAATRAAFLDATVGMSSCSDRRRVLVPVVQQHGDDSTLAGVAEAAGAMTTESERATVLKAVAARRRLSHAAVRKPFFDALGGITSESARGSVLAAAITAEPTSDDVHRAVLQSIGTITSERLRATLLLQLADSTPVLRLPARRAQFLETLGTLTSSTEYRRVMDAVVR